MPYTMPSAPPAPDTTQKRSRWADLFEECRDRPGEWRRMIDPMKRSTAAQIASDIRNVHRRDPGKSRLRGLLASDRWEATWGNDPAENDAEKFYIWLRYVGPQKRGRRAA